jgi:hypothetical protein
MRVCFFIQSHRPPAQLARLVATLARSSPGARILVGHDATGAALRREDLPADADVELFHVPGPIERGRLSQLRPYFAALERLARGGFDLDWVVYLSAQDYPTQPVDALAARLEESGADGFLSFWEAFNPRNPWGRRYQGILRYGYQYSSAPRWLEPLLRRVLWINRLQRAVHLHATYGVQVGRPARWSPFGPGRVCYAGSQWTALSRGCLEFLADAVHHESALLAHYERTIVPDESLVQTLLVNSGRFRLENDTLRYTDFRGSRNGSPRVLGRADLGTLADPRYFFARKFAIEQDAQVLDRLDERLFAAG